MQITVFGATGVTGNEIVSRLLEAGHNVICAVRTPSAVSAAANKCAMKIDLCVHETLMKAISGSDAVISALGTGGLKSARQSTTLYSDSVRAIRKAMRETGCKRLVVLSSGGVDEEPEAPVFYNAIIRRYLMNTYIDMARMETILEESADLEWTVVRLTYLVNGGMKEFLVEDRALGRGNFKISYADAGRFVAQEVFERKWVGKKPVLGYP